MTHPTALSPAVEAKLDALFGRVKAMLPTMDRSHGWSVSNMPAETLERTLAGLAAAAIGYTRPEPTARPLYALPEPKPAPKRWRPGDPPPTFASMSHREE